MTTRWITIDKLEYNADGILQDYIKEHNMTSKKVSLHEHLCRNHVTKLSNKKSKKLGN